MPTDYIRFNGKLTRCRSSGSLSAVAHVASETIRVLSQRQVFVFVFVQTMLYHELSDHAVFALWPDIFRDQGSSVKASSSTSIVLGKNNFHATHRSTVAVSKRLQHAVWYRPQLCCSQTLPAFCDLSFLIHLHRDS